MKYKKLHIFFHIVEAIILIPTHILTFFMFYFSNHEKTTDEKVDWLFKSGIGHFFSVAIWIVLYVIFA